MHRPQLRQRYLKQIIKVRQTVYGFTHYYHTNHLSLYFCLESELYIYMKKPALNYYSWLVELQDVVPFETSLLKAEEKYRQD